MANFTIFPLFPCVKGPLQARLEKNCLVQRHSEDKDLIVGLVAHKNSAQKVKKIVLLQDLDFSEYNYSKDMHVRGQWTYRNQNDFVALAIKNEVPNWNEHIVFICIPTSCTNSLQHCMRWTQGFNTEAFCSLDLAVSKAQEGQVIAIALLSVAFQMTSVAESIFIGSPDSNRLVLMAFVILDVSGVLPEECKFVPGKPCKGIPIPSGQFANTPEASFYINKSRRRVHDGDVIFTLKDVACIMEDLEQREVSAGAKNEKKNRALPRNRSSAFDLFGMCFAQMHSLGGSSHTAVAQSGPLNKKTPHSLNSR